MLYNLGILHATFLPNFVPTGQLVITKVCQADPLNVFVGEAPTGSLDTDAVWSIKKIVTSGTDIFVLRANQGNYDQIWDDRASLVYE